MRVKGINFIQISTSGKPTWQHQEEKEREAKDEAEDEPALAYLDLKMISDMKDTPKQFKILPKEF